METRKSNKKQLVIVGIAVCAIMIFAILLILQKPKKRKTDSVAISKEKSTYESTQRAPDATPSGRRLVKDRRQIESLIDSISKAYPNDQNLQNTLTSLKDGDSEGKVEAIQSLGISTIPEVIPLLVYILQEYPSSDQRAAAAAALDNADASPVAIKALVHALADHEESVRDNAMASLKAIRNPLVKKILVEEQKKGWMSPDIQNDVNLFLDQYYLKRDPFKNPLH